MRGLFVNQASSKQCGIYQYGLAIREALLRSDNNPLDYIESDHAEPVVQMIRRQRYNTVVLNYNAGVFGWATPDMFGDAKVAFIIHDATQFHNYLPIPQDALSRPLRPRLEVQPKVLPNTIGSFGFAFESRGYHNLIEAIAKEYDSATLRLHLPSNSSTGTTASSVTHRFRNNDKVKVELTTSFMSPEQLIFWLAQNELNFFPVTDNYSVGISSRIDWAISAMRPFAVTKSTLFRHIYNANDTVCIENNSLKSIVELGSAPAEFFYRTWTPNRLAENFNELLNT